MPSQHNQRNTQNNQNAQHFIKSIPTKVDGAAFGRPAILCWYIFDASCMHADSFHFLSRVTLYHCHQYSFDLFDCVFHLSPDSLPNSEFLLIGCVRRLKHVPGFCCFFESFGLREGGGPSPEPVWRAERATVSGARQRERSEPKLAEASGRVPETMD